MSTILEYLREHGTFINAPCNGEGCCGKCLVKIKECPPLTKKEKQLLTPTQISKGYVLACQHEMKDITIIYENHVGDILSDVDTIKGNNQEGYGAIIDLGTTTIVFKLIRLKDGQIIKTISEYNHQVSYGSDVISRIKYDTNHPKELHKIIISQIDNIIQLVDEEIQYLYVCGNTTMIHLFNGMNTSSLGVYPFNVPCLGIYESNNLFSKEIRTITLPHISAYVGSDIVMGIYSLDIDEKEKYNALIDLGTNGEIVVGNKEEIITTSSPAGPAFEGQNMECGGPSLKGAISEVCLNEKISFKTIQNGKPICICGSGIISCIAELRRKNIINEMGMFYDGRKQFNLIDDIYISQKDIQSFLLAKSAVKTGLKILLNKINEVDKIYISGGLGNHLKIADLITLKMIDDKYQDKIVIVDNTALQGVYRYCLSNDQKRVERIIKKSVNIDLSQDENFQDELIDGLYI
ncbi:MAG: ASKHA domain-containing protein [Thomasclavelia sp.]|nr:ASKHA domain-containing protein [Thomasclavelia sp.]